MLMDLKGKVVDCSAGVGVLMPVRRGRALVLLEMFCAGEG